MRRNVVHAEAPSVLAASSYCRFTPRNPPSSVMTRKGIATKVSATITPTVVKGSCTPSPL